MLMDKDILDERDKRLRAKNEDMKLPLTKEEKKLINDMLEHLRLSQIEKEAEKYDFRPGMGLAGPQVGVNKNFFVICYEKDEGVFEDFVVINPCKGNNSQCLYLNKPDGIHT